MKRLKKMIILIIFVAMALFAYHLFHFDNRYFVNNDLYKDYKPQTEYQKQYPVSDYVDERMDASAILRGFITGSIVMYDQFNDANGDFTEQAQILLDIYSKRTEYMEFTQNNQYVEPQPIRIEYVGEQEDHNFQYIGYLEDGTEVRGNFAVWETSDQVLTAISFQDGNGNIDINKARLFADDSNAEMLAYLLIEATQTYLGTSYSPDDAAYKFFNCSLEAVAGSIAYHAAGSLASFEFNVGEDAIQKVKTANISTIDDDGFFVNQSY